MDTLPIFITLHAPAFDGRLQEFTVGEEVVINPKYISGMFSAYAGDDESGVEQPCTMLALLGYADPVYVIETPQDIADLILDRMLRRLDGTPSGPSDNGQQPLPYEAVVRDENPWEK